MSHDSNEGREQSQLELVRRASTEDDREIWVILEDNLQETVLSWLHEHPNREVASRMHGEHHFVALAFERLRQAAILGQVACKTFPEGVMYLRASLNGAIMEALRTSSRPRAINEHGSAEQDPQGNSRSEVAWSWVQAALPNEREQRLAYLLYHCGLQPAEIVRCRPQEWSDVHEVARLRRVIFERLMKGLS